MTQPNGQFSRIASKLSRVLAHFGTICPWHNLPVAHFGCAIVCEPSRFADLQRKPVESLLFSCVANAGMGHLVFRLRARCTKFALVK